MDFWIDQYDADFDRIADVAIEISKGGYSEDLKTRFRSFRAERSTIAGLMVEFCELNMIFDLASLGQHNGSGLAAKIENFLEYLSHSNFTEDDAYVLAAIILHRVTASEKAIVLSKSVQNRIFGPRLNTKLVHPKIVIIARNLHSEIDDIYSAIDSSYQKTEK